ncbi:hypothetical protein E2P81_ATG00797 [Venturia nashicola]|uniref:Uncharacterized protein n=1 Tax=Venturia nashicola TaxID=86259 RepID=A0A4Z1PA69_9PEZI|nr:hypothetical protein E6O75_ATG00815 [Venturia nashicola]TLD38254.1 hypothetical protein E2P81_ATG00797 [Venturia nashicola]
MPREVYTSSVRPAQPYPDPSALFSVVQGCLFLPFFLAVYHNGLKTEKLHRQILLRVSVHVIPHKVSRFWCIFDPLAKDEQLTFSMSLDMTSAEARTAPSLSKPRFSGITLEAKVSQASLSKPRFSGITLEAKVSQASLSKPRFSGITLEAKVSQASLSKPRAVSGITLEAKVSQASLSKPRAVSGITLEAKVSQASLSKPRAVAVPQRPRSLFRGNASPGMEWLRPIPKMACALDSPLLPTPS